MPTRREVDLVNKLEAYVAKVKVAEDSKKELQAQLRELRAEKRDLLAQLEDSQGSSTDGGRTTRSGGAASAAASSSSLSSKGKDDATAGEVRKLREEKKALEAKVKEVQRESQRLREQFNDSFEDARTKFRSQGRIHASQVAAKTAGQSSAQITFLKDKVDGLEKANKELDAEVKRLRKESRQASVSEEEVERMRERMLGLERNVETLQDENKDLQLELEFQKGHQAPGQAKAKDKAVEDLKAEVTQLQVELERLLYVEGERDRLAAEVQKLKKASRGKQRGGRAEEEEDEEEEEDPHNAERVKELTALLKASQAQEEDLEREVQRLGTRLRGVEKQQEEWEVLSAEVVDLRTLSQEQEEELKRLRMGSPQRSPQPLPQRSRQQEEEVKRLREEVADLKKRLASLTKARSEAEDRARRLENSPSRKDGGPRAMALAARVGELEEEVARLARETKTLQQANRKLTEESETERMQAQALSKEKKALEQLATRLEAEVEEAEAKAKEAEVKASRATAAAAAAAQQRSVSKTSGSVQQQQPLQEEIAALKEEMELYRNLAASQDQQFSLVYIQEVNAQADYVVVENRTNMDISLAGWALGTALSDGEMQYEFPEELMLSARAHIRVWWGTKNLQHKLRPSRGNLFWEESDRFDIFQDQDDQVVLTDPEGREMSRMNIISGKRRARAGPHGGTPSPDAKKARYSYASVAGSAGEVAKAERRTPFY